MHMHAWLNGEARFSINSRNVDRTRTCETFKQQNLIVVKKARPSLPEHRKEEKQPVKPPANTYYKSIYLYK